MIEELVAQVKSGVDVEGNAYLRALHDGGMTREEFFRSQVQFRFAVVFFPRAMMALAARVSDGATRATLLENVRDELSPHEPTHSHEHTFSTLLQRLGGEGVDAEAGPEVRAFNHALHAACALDDTTEALATLGMIEDLFSGISARIGRAIVQRGWLRADEVSHYPTHELVDVGHAEAFYRCVARRLPVERDAALRGLRSGAFIFLRLYEDLRRASTR